MTDHDETQMGSSNWAFRQRIYNEINVERDRQDERWGGPEHDDQHVNSDWSELIQRQIIRALDGDDDPRDCFIKTAALAVAAVESLDRVRYCS